MCPITECGAHDALDDLAVFGAALQLDAPLRLATRPSRFHRLVGAGLGTNRTHVPDQVRAVVPRPGQVDHLVHGHRSVVWWPCTTMPSESPTSRTSIWA